MTDPSLSSFRPKTNHLPLSSSLGAKFFSLSFLFSLFSSSNLLVFSVLVLVLVIYQKLFTINSRNLTLPMPDGEPNIIADQKPSTTVTSNKMDKLEQTILKTAIEAIPLLTIDNYSLWKN
ncbi:hypothetical protein VP01_441g1 [Puccinia sorghi]|uniref:Uncharacterized protein n=1 Tax=Puccinia sorghi TaxID=27349 RepID=A0A0L6UPI8_9BASI|nr:hypothetical protein VP01_441g1 [Puccinia sorghi]